MPGIPDACEGCLHQESAIFFKGQSSNFQMSKTNAGTGSSSFSSAGPVKIHSVKIIERSVTLRRPEIIRGF